MYGIYTSTIWIEGVRHEAVGVALCRRDTSPDTAILYTSHPDHPIIYMEGGKLVDNIDNKSTALLIPAFYAIGDDCQTYLLDDQCRNDFWWMIKGKLDEMNEASLKKGLEEQVKIIA